VVVCCCCSCCCCCCSRLRDLREAETIVTNKILCHMCGGAGHIARDCKQKRFVFNRSYSCMWCDRLLAWYCRPSVCLSVTLCIEAIIIIIIIIIIDLYSSISHKTLKSWQEAKADLSLKLYHYHNETKRPPMGHKCKHDDVIKLLRCSYARLFCPWTYFYSSRATSLT